MKDKDKGFRWVFNNQLYEPKLYSHGMLMPPPEWERGSLPVDIAVGCSHNKCAFCPYYKSIKAHDKELAQIEEDLQTLKQKTDSASYNVERIFFASGNALRRLDLVEIMDMCKSVFPNLKSFTSYGSAKDILKQGENLTSVCDSGYDTVYLGVETGLDSLLQDMYKGVTREQMKTAGIMAREAGIMVGASIIIGLGGAKQTDSGLQYNAEHARETASLLNEIEPYSVRLLTMVDVPGAVIYHRRLQQGKIIPATPVMAMQEMIDLVEGLEIDCIFLTSHSSNYINLEAVLQRHKNEVLRFFREALEKPDKLARFESL